MQPELVVDYRMTNKTLYLDRSRTEVKQHCPRKGYWNYYYKGRGIEAAREIPPPWPLLTGGYVHEGIETILKGGYDPRDVALSFRTKYEADILPLFRDLEEGPALDVLKHNLK